MVSPDNVTDSTAMDRQPKKDVNRHTETNGNNPNTPDVQLLNEEGLKPPSYVGLACCISGYSTLSYDPVRQGMRSVSPLRMTDHRIHNTNDCNNQNIITNEMQTQNKTLEVLNGFGSLHSPKHVNNLKVSQESKNYFNQTVTETYTVKNSKTSIRQQTASSYCYSSNNGNESHLLTPTKFANIDINNDNFKNLSPSSFILQRVERLYGPGALAQGFYMRRKSEEKENRITIDIVKKENLENDSKNESLPVMRLLSPEFRAQLKVANRKPSLEKTLDSEEEICARNGDLKNGQIITDQLDGCIEKTNSINYGLIEINKDGEYFLKLLDKQVEQLEILAAKTEKDVEICKDEDLQGMLRSTAGKARLLVAEKLQQFRGLCQKNLNQSSTEDFPTTNEDLAGFWDMVMIQIVEVLSQFEKIDVIRKNNWVNIEEKTNEKTPVRTSTTPKSNKKSLNNSSSSSSSSTPSPANKARDEARRKMLDEKRRAMKDNLKNRTTPNKKNSDDSLLFIV